MDKLKELGRDIPSVIGPTYEIYGSLLRQNDRASAIHSTQRQEYSYGPHERQKLDHYAPTRLATAGSDDPVLMFVYGGGFISGDKRIKEIPDDVAYTNIGHFFAEKSGFDTILIDYRLIGHEARYPSGAEDVDLALRWMEKRFSDRRSLYLLGNSAGGVHIASWLFGSRYTEHRRLLTEASHMVCHLKIEAVGFLSTPFHLDPEGGMKPLLRAYYGEPGLVRAEEPQKLMLDTIEHLSREAVAQWPRLAVIVCELDPETDIRHAGRQFFELWRSKGGLGQFVDLPGHNHISPVLSLGTGLLREEVWGHDFGNWLKAQSVH